MAKENEIVLFETEDKEITLNVKVDQDTVWLNRNQMADLFGRDVKTIGKHINNALKEELDNSTVANFATVQNEGGRDVGRKIEYYNLEKIKTDIAFIVAHMKDVDAQELNDNEILFDSMLFRMIQISENAKKLSGEL